MPCSTRSPAWSSGPNVLACQFDPQFLDVPSECLILTMKANQKYFPLVDSEGRLTQHFLVVSNIHPADPSRIIEGNQRVVRPRLADAKFFFDEDRKKTLEARVPLLAKMVYHAKLGSMGERVKRVCKLAGNIARLLEVDICREDGEDETDHLLRYEPADTRDHFDPLRATRRAAGQGRSGERHGRRIPRAAGHHGRLLRAPRW